MISRLRAAFTPQAFFLMISLMLAVWLLFGSAENDGGTTLEQRISKTLSSMEGAGKVEVVIATRQAEGKTSMLKGQAGEEIPCGAMAVAQGADDPWVQAKITDALCALLGLPASAVSVISGGD